MIRNIPFLNVGSFLAKSSLFGVPETEPIAFVVISSKSCFIGRSGFDLTSPLNSCRVALTIFFDTSARWLCCSWWWNFKDSSPFKSPRVASVALHDFSTHLKYVVWFGPWGPLFHFMRKPKWSIWTFSLPLRIFWNSILKHDAKVYQTFTYVDWLNW